MFALIDAFDRAGIEFIESDNGGGGVRYKKGGPSP
jgi:hypothetical protein